MRLFAGLSAALALFAACTEYGSEEPAAAPPSAEAPPNDDVPMVTPTLGAYVYTGLDLETIATTGADASFDAGYGGDMVARIVGLDAGCYRFTIGVNAKHDESLDFCTTKAGLVQVAASDVQRNFPIDNTSSLDCSNPPNVFVTSTMKLGDSFVQNCVGSNLGVDGGFLLHGDLVWQSTDAVTIEGDAEPARHLVSTNDLRGTQTGTLVNEYWISEKDGLILRGVRKMTVTSPLAIGEVTGFAYTETNGWSLKSRSIVDASSGD